MAPLTDAQQARLDALPEPLRQWTREHPAAHYYLAQHILHGLPLGRALARLARQVGHDTTAKRARTEDDHGWTVPGCAASWPEGHCYAPSVRPPRWADDRSGAYPVCDDCRARARWQAEDYGRAYWQVPDHDQDRRNGPYRPRPGVVAASDPSDHHSRAGRR